MFEKERVKQEKIDTRDPEISGMIWAKSVCNTAADVLMSLFIEEEGPGKEDSLYGRFLKYRSAEEKLIDLSNKETFLNGCREFEDKIEAETNQQKKERLTKRFDAYKKEWEKQTKREMENIEIRDKKIALRREMFGI